jgi:hypothetical protein
VCPPCTRMPSPSNPARCRDGDCGLAYGLLRDAFGPEVSVPADAPALVRLVAFSGRDPDWARTAAG